MSAKLPKTVNLSDGLLSAARTAAARSGRSLIKQIEFWVRLGRGIDDELRPPIARNLLRRYPLPRGRTKQARPKKRPQK